MSDGHHLTERLPNAVEQFIIANIASVDLLEMLLLLHGQPQRKWSPQEIGIELRTNTFAGQNGLVRLCAMGVAISDREGFRYQPANTEIDSVVAQLEHVYLNRRVAVISCIYSKRDSNIRAFADAFRISDAPRKGDSKP